MDSLKYGQFPVERLSVVIEENLHSFYACLARYTTCSQQALHGICWMSPDNSTWPNLIFSANLKPGYYEEDLSAITRSIVQKTIPPVWLVGPLAQPVELPELLTAHGFSQVMNWCGMALALEAMLDSPEDTARMPHSGHNQQASAELPDCTIEVVDSPEILAEWLQVVQTGLLRNSQIGVEYFAKLLPVEDVKFYLARAAGKPVGTALMYMAPGEKIAGLYLIAVLPEYRGRGIGRQLTLRPLHEARQRGAQLAVLQATQSGEALYRKIGFREFCRFGIYKYQD